jgi:hypothetical protein
MSHTLGLGIGTESIRALALRGGRVVAATEAEIAPGEPLADAVAELLAALPLRRFPRPRVVAALGPGLSQTRRVSGLPPLDDPRLTERIVREGAGKFFLRGGGPLLTTGVRPAEPGTAWCAALDERAVRAVAQGCRAAGYALDAAVPAVAVLGYGLAGERWVWTDGDARAEVVTAAGVLQAVRRLPDPAPGAPAEARPALAALGEHAWRFADAYGAASLPKGESMVHRPGREADGGARVPAWRLAAAAAVLAVATGAALTGPALRAMDAEDAAIAELALLGDERRAAADVQRELGRATAALGEIAAFDEGRYSPTVLLEALTAALPAGAAMVALRIDTAGGSIVALGARAAALVPALEKVPGVVGPEIVGPVTRETAAGREVERATIRFGIDPHARRAAAGDADEVNGGAEAGR